MGVVKSAGLFRIAGRSAYAVNATTFLFFAGWQSMLPFIALHVIALGATPSTVGVIMGGYSLAPLLLALPTGVLTERIGPARLMVVGCLTGSVSLLFIALGDSLLTLVGALFIFGLAQLAVTTSTQVATVMVPSANRDSAIGHYFFAASLGQICGPMLGSLLVDGADYDRAFLGAAVLTGASALVAAGQIRLRPAQETLVARSRLFGTLLTTLRNSPPVTPGLVSSLTAELTVAFWYAFFPILLISKGFGAGTIALFFSLRGIFTAAVRPMLGHLTRWTSRTNVLTGSMAALAASLALMPIVRSTPSVAATVVIFGISAGIVFPMTMAIVSSAFPDESAGLGVGIRLLMTRIGQVLGPPLLGLFVEYSGIRVAFIAAAGILAVTLSVRGKDRAVSGQN